jgi:hypothetical protein
MEVSVQIVLNPAGTKRAELRDVYNRALDEAEELYIASAYLTDWDASYRLSSKCKRVVFLVGTDFGLTRKAAMLNVLDWIPKGIPFSFLAVQSQPGGFHPKIVTWKAASGKCHCLIGSSNLSKAAFSDNYEANVMTEISSRDFARVREWLESVSQFSSPISKDWINHHYKEAKLRPKKRGTDSRVIQLKQTDLPHGRACAQAVRQHRQQQAAFREIGGPIRKAAAQCSRGEISRSQFWRTFWNLWAHHESRFQGSGLQFAGKSAKWEDACNALISILDARKSSSTTQLDQLVSNAIDQLHETRNPIRHAWLSEMLCHYFPELYPISNKPVQKWLSKIKLRGRTGATEGQRYIDLAQKLRLAVHNEHPAGARNLAELDGAIWRWTKDQGLLDS